LKAHTETVLDLPADRVALPCASGTHALFAAAALAEREFERRWIVSAYGFRATVIGPFANTIVIDCDENGIIDVGRLVDRVNDYDGIVATNPFGLLADMKTLVDFSRKQQKVLIIDNAAAFVGFDRSDHAGVFECLSFHHTKPYGFGEGGCLIVDRVLQDRARSVLDFGYRFEQSGGRRGMSNGKLSEPAAAFILARHLSEPNWAPAYRQQFARILGIAGKQGFRPLIDEKSIGQGAYGNLPLIASFAIGEDFLPNDVTTLRKYYKPLAPCETATNLYSRIVNFPIHPGIQNIEDRVVTELFAEIRSRVSKG